MNDKPFRIELDQSQIDTVAFTGYVDLTAEQVWAAAGSFRGRHGGTPKKDGPRCQCGCGWALDKALKRHPRRAVGDIKQLEQLEAERQLAEAEWLKKASRNMRRRQARSKT